MFTFVEGGSNPGLVIIGIVIAQLFLYGRKIKTHAKIHRRQLVGDVMQLGVLFITCMGFTRIADGVLGFKIKDAWQLITMVIVFNMSFDQLFDKARKAFVQRGSAIIDAAMGNTPSLAPMNDAAKDSITTSLKGAYGPEEIPADQMELLRRLDNEQETG